MEQKAKIASNKDVALMAPGRWSVEGETGLYLYVSPDGQVRRWIFRYTSPATKRVTEAGLDLASAVSLAQAKTKAHDMRKQIAANICPINARRQERQASITFKEVCDSWIETHRTAWRGGDTGSQMKNTKVLLFKHGAPLAQKPIASINADMIQAALEQLWKRAPNQGRRTLAIWERIFNFAKAKGMRQGDNPAAWEACHEYRFARQRPTDRHHPAMDYTQLPQFIRDLRERQAKATWAVALEFLILTVARTSEVLKAQWSEIDFENRLWNVPKDRMKAGRAHQVPLSDRAMELLRRQQEQSNGSPYIFTGYSQRPLANKTMLNSLRSMCIKDSVHGFRSTFRNWAGDVTMFQREIIEECLAHQVGSDVERAYRRTTALEKRRVIMDAWADYCTGGRHVIKLRAA
jgi:integrase